MADTKISALSAAAALAGTEVLPIVQSAATVKATAANVAALATATTVGLGSVTNDVQTKAAIVPNTAPAAGQLLAGNAGGTAYAPVTASGDLTVASTGAVTLATVNGNVGSFTNSSITVNAKGLITAASSGAASGDVVGPASATDNNLCRFDGSTGKLIQTSAVTVDDTTGNISGVGTAGAWTVSATAGAADSLVLRAPGSGGFVDITATATVIARINGSGFALGSRAATFGWNGTGIGFANTVGLGYSASGLLEINSGTGGTFRDLKVRQHYVDQTITAGGSTGAQTINKCAGTVNFAAAAATLVVTNSLCTTSSSVYCSVRTADATADIKSVVPASGSFTITLNAAATAETSVGFLVIN